MAQTQTSTLGTADCRLTNRSATLLSNNLLCCIILLCFFAGGCSSVLGTGSGKLSFEKLAATYNSVTLKKSLTLDVVPVMQRSEAELGPMLAGTELLSRSDNTIASLGQNKDKTLTWFNMVGFSEENLTADRKYFFVVSEKKPSFTGKVNKGMRFDCEMVLNTRLFLGSYQSQSEKQIEILKYIRDNFRRDIDKFSIDPKTPGQSDQMLSVCGMLLNQTFETILRKLESSPVLATRLSEPAGVHFDHISFNQGAIRMIIESDIAIVHIRLGALVDTL